MRFTLDKDTRTFCVGAGLALTCGIMLGGAMRPDLGYDGRPAGPQQISTRGGERSTGPFDSGTTYGGYSGRVPDYVLGADWKRAMAASTEPAAVSAPAPERVADREVDGLTTEGSKPDWAQPAHRGASDEPPPAPRGRYPSLGGETAPDEPDAAADPTVG
jgi:hypothetical protein